MLVDMKTHREIRILLIEDNPGDVLLFREALKECAAPCTIHVARDGEEARGILFSNRRGSESLPDLIVLDLNLPRVPGDQLLLLIKADAELRSIPVLILTSSTSADDIWRCYANQASCYIVKPAELGEYMRLMRAWGDFWMSQATLPPRREILHGSV